METLGKVFATIFAKRSKNQGEIYKNSLDTFVKGSDGKRKEYKINMRTQEQMALGNSKPENQRFLLEPSWACEGQGEQRIKDAACYFRERYAEVNLKINL